MKTWVWHSGSNRPVRETFCKEQSSRELIEIRTIKHSKRQLKTLLSCFLSFYFWIHFRFHAKLIALIVYFDASLEAKVKRNAKEKVRKFKQSDEKTCENVTRRSEEFFPLNQRLWCCILSKNTLVSCISFISCIIATGLKSIGNPMEI